jgi:hypothetical protein
MGKALGVQQMQASLLGASWATRFLEMGETHVSHQGKSLRFKRNPQPDGTVFAAAQVDHYLAITEEKPGPPYFAGSIWYKTTTEYIAKNAQTCRLGGKAVVNGANATVLEWDVPKDSIGMAFGPITDRMSGGGVLRLYVAPQYGYALPKIEYVASDGGLGKVFDSEGFEAAQPGVFLPKSCKSQAYGKDGRAEFYVRYTISRFELINDSVPQDDFIVSLPKGTFVNDARARDGRAFFTVGEVATVPEGISDIVRIDSSHTFAQRWRIVFILANVFIVLLFIGILLVRRRKRIASKAAQ